MSDKKRFFISLASSAMRGCLPCLFSDSLGQAYEREIRRMKTIRTLRQCRQHQPSVGYRFQLFFFQSTLSIIIPLSATESVYRKIVVSDGVFQVECPDIQRKSFRTPPGFRRSASGQLLVDIQLLFRSSCNKMTVGQSSQVFCHTLFRVR